MEAKGPPELQILNIYEHPTATLVKHTATHGVIITIPRGVAKEDQTIDLHYSQICFRHPRGGIFPPVSGGTDPSR